MWGTTSLLHCHKYLPLYQEKNQICLCHMFVWLLNGTLNNDIDKIDERLTTLGYKAQLECVKLEVGSNPALVNFSLFNPKLVKKDHR